jgi:hypothetical protein
MKKFIQIVVCTLSMFSTACLAQDDFSPELQIFSKFIGTWESTFEMMDGNPSVVDVAVWERALNGKAIRSLHSINEGMYGGEMIMTWDRNVDSLVFYYFTTADFYTSGTIEVVDENSFIAYEDVNGSKDGITKVKSTSTLKGNVIIVITSYLKNGQWTHPETRTYRRSTKNVIFK